MEPPENIVLVSVDDLRYDCVEATDSLAWLDRYGAGDVLDTPTMNELIESGHSFDRATSASSYTPPSHASMFTGAYPSEHGVKTFFNRLTEQRTLAEALSDAGYETVAWVENMALQMLDVTAGFDRVVCPFEDEDVNLFDFVDSVAGSNRTFLFVHLFDVHKPYGYATGGTERYEYNRDYPACLDGLLPAGIEPSSMLGDARDEAAETVPNYEGLTEPLREFANYRSLDYLLRKRLEDARGDHRFEDLIRLYVEGVNRFDRNRLPDLLERLEANDLLDDLFVFTSDHGETRCRWGDREDLMNSFNVSEGAVRVPLVFEGNCLADLSPSDVPVSHVDLAPTVLDAAGLDSTTPSGQSLLRSPDPERALFNESWYYSGGADFFGNVSETGEGGLSEAAVRIGDCKLVRSFAETGTPDRVVRRLDAPIPEETDAEESCSPLGPFEDTIDAFLQDVDRTCSSDIGPDQDAMEDRLRALGYLE